MFASAFHQFYMRAMLIRELYSCISFANKLFPSRLPKSTMILVQIKHHFGAEIDKTNSNLEFEVGYDREKIDRTYRT